MGRPEFETVVANAPKEKMLYTDLGQPMNLLAGQGQVFHIYAPAGYIAEMKAMWLSIMPPTGATTGTHTFAFGYDNIYLAKGDSTFNTSVQWYYNNWFSANSSQNPPQAVQSSLINTLVFDDVTPFRFAYTNGTDAVQNQNLTARFFYKLRQTAK